MMFCLEVNYLHLPTDCFMKMLEWRVMKQSIGDTVGDTDFLYGQMSKFFLVRIFT